eukprot:COSAG02_NODE_241_length_27638_cov_13.101020_14_plen_1764_part_00
MKKEQEQEKEPAQHAQPAERELIRSMGDGAVSEAELDALVASLDAEEGAGAADVQGLQPAPELPAEQAGEPPQPEAATEAEPAGSPDPEPEPEPEPGPRTLPPLENPFLKPKPKLKPLAATEPEPEPDPGVRDGGTAYHTDGIRAGGTTTVLWERSLDVVAMGDDLPLEGLTEEGVADLSVAETKAELTKRGANALGRKAVLKERLVQVIARDRTAEAAGHLWALCTESYVDEDHADVIRSKPGLVRRLVQLVCRGAESTNHIITEPACAALHTLCTDPKTLAAVPSAVPALVKLIAGGSVDSDVDEPTSERLTEDAAGLLHKLAHSEPSGLCRSDMLDAGIVPVILQLLAQTPSWFLDGGKLGQELFAGEAGGTASIATGAANERVVEECLGTLRNLAEVKAGRVAIMAEAEDTVDILLRLIEDRGEFTKQVGFASHSQRHGFSGYTFERVQQGCLGILHSLLADPKHEVPMRQVLRDTDVVRVLTSLMEHGNNLKVHETSLCVLQCLAYSKASVEHLVDMGAILPVAQQLTAGQESLVQNNRHLGDRVGGTDGGLLDVVRMVEAAVGILANVAFYSPRKPPPAVVISKSTLAVKTSRGNVASVRNPHAVKSNDAVDDGPAGPNEIVASGAVAVLVALMTSKVVGKRGSKRYALLGGIVEAAASALRNLAFHEDCVSAVYVAGAVGIITRMFQAHGHVDEELPGLRGNSLPLVEATLGCIHNVIFFPKARIEMLSHRWMISVLGELTVAGADGLLNDPSGVSRSLLREVIGCLRHLSVESDVTAEIVDTGAVPALVRLMKASEDRDIYELSAVCLRNLVAGAGRDTEQARAVEVQAGAMHFFIDDVVLRALKQSEGTERSIDEAGDARFIDIKKASTLQRHAVGMLAYVASNPQCQQRIVDVHAIKPISMMLRIQFQSLERSGVSAPDRSNTEDFLQSTMMLLYKLCDDPEGKAHIVEQALVPELVTIMQHKALTDKSCSTAKEILTQLIGERLVENDNWLQTQTPQRQIVPAGDGSPGSIDSRDSPFAQAYQDMLPSDTLDQVDDLQYKMQSSTLALAMSRRSVLGDIITQERVMELSNRPPADTIVTFADAVEKDVRKVKRESFMERLRRMREERRAPPDPYEIGKPVTILHKGQSYLVSTHILPERKWDIGFAVCFTLTLVATVAVAFVLHQEYTIKEYAGTRDDKGQATQSITESTAHLDTMTTDDKSGAWIWTTDPDASSGVPVFVCIQACIVGGLAAVVWSMLICRTLALHVVEVVPVGLTFACWYWNTRLSDATFSTEVAVVRRMQEARGLADTSSSGDGGDSSDTAVEAAAQLAYVTCGIRTYIWWFLIIMLGQFFRFWYHGRRGRQLAMAFFNVGRLIFSEGDPWLSIIMLLTICVQVAWTAAWIIALSAVLSLDGEKQASLRTMGSLLLAISFYWSAQVFQYITHVVGAACAASWYRTTPSPVGTPTTLCPWTARRVAWRSFRKACTVSLGSICAASILASFVQFLRVVLPQPPQLKYEGAPSAITSIPFVGKKISPDIAAKMDRVWDVVTAAYIAFVLFSWHVLDSLSQTANIAVFVQFPAANLSPMGPKMSGKYTSLAADAWRTTNRAGLQPLRQEPLYYCLVLSCCFSTGAISAGWACTQIKGDYSCATAQLAIFLAFVCGFVPAATLFGAGEGMVNALLTLFVEEQATLLQKDSRFYAAVLVAMEAAQAGGHLNAPGTTKPPPDVIEKKKLEKQDKKAKTKGNKVAPEPPEASHDLVDDVEPSNDEGP